MEDVNKRDKLFFLFLNLSAVPKKSTPEKLAYISYFQQIEIKKHNKVGKNANSL